MGQYAAKNAKLIEEIAHGGKKQTYPLMSGKIVAGSVDTEGMTVKVLLSVDEDVPTEDIFLNVVLSNVGGCYGLPADNADCIVGEIDGPGRWELIRASRYTKVVIQGVAIQFNDGSLGGLPILQKIVDNQNAIKNYIKTVLEPAINTGLTGVGVGSAASGTTGATDFGTAIGTNTITYEDMENTNIKQG